MAIFRRGYLTISSIVLATAAAVALTAMPLVDAPLYVILSEGLIQGILVVVLIFLVIRTVRFAGMSTLPPLQRGINNAAMALLFTVLWLGGSLLLTLLIFGEPTAVMYASLLPLRALLSLAVYGATVYFTAVRTLPAETDEHAPEDAAPQPKSETIEFVAVKNSRKVDVVAVSDIETIMAEGDYVMIYTAKGRFLKEQTMKYFSEALPPDRFVRVHRSAIVNVDYITGIESYDKNSRLISLRGGMKVTASLSGYRSLKQTLNL